MRVWREWSGISIADLKTGEVRAETALWSKTSNAIKSSVSGGKNGSTPNVCRKFKDT